MPQLFSFNMRKSSFPNLEKREVESLLRNRPLINLIRLSDSCSLTYNDANCQRNKIVLTHTCVLIRYIIWSQIDPWLTHVTWIGHKIRGNILRFLHWSKAKRSFRSSDTLNLGQWSSLMSTKHKLKSSGKLQIQIINESTL